MVPQTAPWKTERYLAAVAQSSSDVSEAQAFRAQCFDLPRGFDTDPWDAAYDHLVIRCVETGAIVCCCRFKALGGADIASGYSGQFYDLSPLKSLKGQALELGRFCIDPEHRDPDILRFAWAILTGYVDQLNAVLLFGCASFPGTLPAPYSAAFAYLHAEAVLRDGLSPRRKAAQVYGLYAYGDRSFDKRVALRQMPPLLRSYLGMGGGVSDHAVVDEAMNTLHVFTAVEIAMIPPARQKLLRALRRGYAFA